MNMHALKIILALFLVSFAAWNIWLNNLVVISLVNIENRQVPEEFDGFRIIQVSDFHNDKFGRNQLRLIDKIKETKPDLIVMTGDLIDRRRTDIDIAVSLARGLAKIAPTCFVSGNHEVLSGEYETLKKKLERAGVILLDDASFVIRSKKAAVRIDGVRNPSERERSDQVRNIERSLASIKGESADFSILLAHRPDLFEVYERFDYDLIFSGHAHGGQFRFPFIGGLLAPDQGFFPKYDSGPYRLGKTTMIVSRGLGNSLFPFRLNNGPELVLVKLERDF